MAHHVGLGFTKFVCGQPGYLGMLVRLLIRWNAQIARTEVVVPLPPCAIREGSGRGQVREAQAIDTNFFAYLTNQCSTVILSGTRLASSKTPRTVANHLERQKA